MEGKIVEENGIRILVKPNCDKPGKCKTFYNPTMQICRELVLCNLAVYAKSPDPPPLCLDAFGATGIGGLQWKHHLGSDVNVSINEMNADAVADIKANCDRNNILVCDTNVAEPLPQTAGPPDINTESVKSDESEKVDRVNEVDTSGNQGPGVGDQVPSSGQSTDQGSSDSQAGDAGVNGDPAASGSRRVEVIQDDANITMHRRQFNFINLDPYGTTVPFLDAAFRNLYNKGVMVLTSTDIASLYGKCPQVTARNYSAFTLKTDYTKELAARLVLAAAARSAARCHKGLHVLYAVGVEHFVQVAVQVRRGIQPADASLLQVRKVLHCQMCEEWALMPDTKAPIEDPYNVLPCDCHSQFPGKTGVELGPLWAGELFDADYVQKMGLQARKLGLNDRIRSLLDTMYKESVCCSNHDRDTSHGTADHQTSSGTTSDCGNKRPSEDSGLPSKRSRPCRDVPTDCMPMFYYNLHRRKFKGGNLPKYNKLVTLLQTAGFRASRTHFEPEAIRTNATLNELTAFVIKQDKS